MSNLSTPRALRPARPTVPTPDTQTLGLLIAAAFSGLFWCVIGGAAGFYFARLLH